MEVLLENESFSFSVEILNLEYIEDFCRSLNFSSKFFVFSLIRLVCSFEIVSSDSSASNYVIQKKIQPWNCHFFLAWYVLFFAASFLFLSVFLSSPSRSGLSE